MMKLAMGLELDSLFGFKKLAKNTAKLEDAVGAAFNKRGEGPPATPRSQSVVVGQTEDVAKDFGGRKGRVG